MFYVICGDIVFDKDDHYKDVATIVKCVMVGVEYDEKTAMDVGSWFCDFMGLDYVIPQLFNGQIINNTKKTIAMAQNLWLHPDKSLNYFDLLEAEARSYDGIPNEPPTQKRL